MQIDAITLVLALIVMYTIVGVHRRLERITEELVALRKQVPGYRPPTEEDVESSE